MKSSSIQRIARTLSTQGRLKFLAKLQGPQSDEMVKFEYAQAYLAANGSSNADRLSLLLSEGLDRSKMKQSKEFQSLWLLLKLNAAAFCVNGEQELVSTCRECLEICRESAPLVSVFEYLFAIRQQSKRELLFKYSDASDTLIKSLLTLLETLYLYVFGESVADVAVADDLPPKCSIPLTANISVELDLSNFVGLPRIIRIFSHIGTLDGSYRNQLQGFSYNSFHSNLFHAIQSISRSIPFEIKGALVSHLNSEEYVKYKNLIHCLYALNEIVKGQAELAETMLTNLLPRLTANAAEPESKYLESFVQFQLFLLNPSKNQNIKAELLKHNPMTTSVLDALAYLHLEEFHKTKVSLLEALKHVKSSNDSNSLLLCNNQLRFITLLTLAHVYQKTQNTQASKMLEAANAVKEIIIGAIDT